MGLYSSSLLHNGITLLIGDLPYVVLELFPGVR